MSRKDMPVLGTTYRSFEKSILKTAEKCEHFTMSTKVKIKKTKDTSKVMSKDEAWQHYSAEMTKKIETLYSTIKTQHTIIETQNKEIEDLDKMALEQLNEKELEIQMLKEAVQRFEMDYGRYSDSSSDSESESEDNEAPPPYEQ